MVRAAIAAASVALVAALLNGATDTPQTYRNEEFGITLAIPAGAMLCPIPGDEHVHGPVLLVGSTNTKDCVDPSAHRSVDIFARFNAMQETKTLEKFLKAQCTAVFKEECLPAPRHLGVDGMRSAAARVNHADSWIDIFVVTQAGNPDPLFDASVPSINYNLRLHTRPEHLKEDLRVFRTVLDTVRLSLPQ